MKKGLSILVCVLILAGFLVFFGENGEASANYYRFHYYATPRLIVTGADVKGGPVEAGENFKLILHLENASSSADLVNIRLKLSSADNRIITASGSDTIYIDRFAPDEKMDVTVEMCSMPDLEQKVYTVTCQYSYENLQKETFTDTASLSVPIIQPPRISVSEKKLSRTEIYVEGKTSLSMKINNLGKGKVYNVQVELKGPTISDITTFVGNLEMGASKAVDVSLVGTAAGEDAVTATVTYEDADGNVQQLEETFELSVLEDADEEYVEEASGLSPVQLAVIAGAAVVVILVVAAIRRRKKERQYE